jgi:hypothetical protein
MTIRKQCVAPTVPRHASVLITRASHTRMLTNVYARLEQQDQDGDGNLGHAEIAKLCTVLRFLYTAQSGRKRGGEGEGGREHDEMMW